MVIENVFGFCALGREYFFSIMALYIWHINKMLTAKKIIKKLNETKTVITAPSKQ